MSSEDEQKPTWTEGAWGDHATIRMEYTVEGQEPDEVQIMPLRSQKTAIMYPKNPWVRMNAEDMYRLGEFLQEGAIAFGYVPEADSES